MTQIDRRAFLAASAALAATPGLTAVSRTAGWTARAPMPWPAQEIYAAAWRGRVVVAGGLVGRTDAPLHIEHRVGLYDPAADAWSEGAALPAPRHHPMVVSDGAEGLFAIGGYGRSEAGEWTSSPDAWRLGDGGWTPIAPLPTPQAETVGIGHGGAVHLIGGRSPTGAANGQWNDQGDVDLHQVYRPAEDRWETLRPAPMARNSAAGALMDGAIWVAGGRTVSGGGTGRLDRYDPAADRWDTLAPIPPSPSTGHQVGGGLAMAALDGKLVAFGGEWFRPRAEGGGGGVFAETWIYDPARDSWERGPDMATPRHGLAAATVGDAIYAIAGGAVVSGGRAVGTVEAFRL